MSTDVYTRFSRRLLTEEQLRYFDYPRPDPSGREGVVKLYGDHFGFKDGFCRNCDKMFDITFTKREMCSHHAEKTRKYKRLQQQHHICCGKPYGSSGCTTAPSHVYEGNIYLDLEGYKHTLPASSIVNGNRGVYALDTESIHTVKGLEVCKVTLIDSRQNIVYDEYCLPTTEIIGYNTIWSGITEGDLLGVQKTFKEMRDDLLQIISADTILVGHGLSSDLISTKIIHDKVVDTLVLYPHNRGLPFRRALKEIAEHELSLKIQKRDGHDSFEDAKVALRLALRKV